MTDSLDHVVYSQCGNTGSRQCFHFHPSLGSDSTLAFNHDSTALQDNINLDLFQWEGMTQWNQVTSVSVKVQ